MCFSRIYLGAHTYNQVIFGTMVGTLMALIYHYQLKWFYYEQPERHFNLDKGTGYIVKAGEYVKTIVLDCVIPINIAIATYFLQ